MEAVVVVVMFPVADDDAGVRERPEGVDVEAFVADPGVEGLDVAVEPGLSGVMSKILSHHAIDSSRSRTVMPTWCISPN